MIICQILVTFYLGKIPIIDKVAVEGKILKENEFNYLVDFSRDAQEKAYHGNYSKVLVSKKECIKE